MMFLYGFSGAHIQRYIVRSSRLRDIQGASQLLEDLCGDVFRNVVQDSGLRKDDIVSQAAGGARVASNDPDALLRLHAVWPFVAHMLAPGLDIDQAIVPVEDEQLAKAHSDLSIALKAARNYRTPSLPVLGPLVRRAPRTGGGAVDFDKHDGVVDSEMFAKRQAWKHLRQPSRQWGSELDRKFLGDRLKNFRFVGGADTDVLADEGNYVALIHADGNAVGQTIHSLLTKENSIESREGAFKRFSQALSDATKAATVHAVEQVLVPMANDSVLPARPILLGGDDVTILVRGDLGLEFARVFLESFEEETSDRKSELTTDMSACAGIAFIKENYPYDRAHDLADALCRRAKRIVKSQPTKFGPGLASALSFHKVTTSLTDSDAGIDHTLMGPSKVVLTMGAYGVGRDSGTISSLDALYDLSNNLPTDNRGGIRELIDALMENQSLADTKLDRLVQVQEGRGKSMQRFKQALAALTGAPHRLFTTDNTSPLLDALIAKEFGMSTQQSVDAPGGEG